MPGQASRASSHRRAGGARRLKAHAHAGCARRRRGGASSSRARGPRPPLLAPPSPPPSRKRVVGRSGPGVRLGRGRLAEAAAAGGARFLRLRLPRLLPASVSFRGPARAGLAEAAVAGGARGGARGLCAAVKLRGCGLRGRPPRRPSPTAHAAVDFVCCVTRPSRLRCLQTGLGLCAPSNEKQRPPQRPSPTARASPRPRRGRRRSRAAPPPPSDASALLCWKAEGL